MIYRNVKTNLKKAATGYGIYICTVFTVILCFSADIYTDPLNGNRYSVFMALRTFDRDFMLTNIVFCYFNVIQIATGSWLTMFIPIISAFAYIPLVCDEYEAKSVRFEIARSSKKNYYLSRFFSACFCGGCAVTVGYVIFSVLAWILFPSIDDYSIELQTEFYEMMQYNFPELKDGFALPILQKFGSIFLYGTVSAVPAIVLTAAIRNKYLVMCIPFFLKYAIGQTCLKLQSQAVEDYENIDIQLMRLTKTVHPDSLAILSQLGDSKSSVLIYNSFLIVAGLIIYLIVQLRRTDCGE